MNHLKKEIIYKKKLSTMLIKNTTIVDTVTKLKLIKVKRKYIATSAVKQM